MNPSPCDRLTASLSQLFVCSQQGEFQRIRTPFLYPDGDNIDLFCKDNGADGILLTDLGETSRWLKMQTVSARKTVKQKALIQDVALNHGVEVFRGMLQARCRNTDDFSAITMRVAQAALRVSDLWFTFRTRSTESVTDEVQDFLDEEDVQFVRSESIPGRSGRVWTPDFHTRTPARSSLIYVLSTGSRSAARGIAEHVLAAWYDLSQLKVGPEGIQFVSLFDDTLDVWSEEDFRLLQDFSTIARWSEPKALARHLGVAA